MKRMSSDMGDVLVLDDFLPYLVSVLANRMSTQLAKVYEERFGISIPEWRVIANLAQNKNVSVREIQARVHMDKAKVSRAAARLESVGIVEKNVNTGDRRLVELRLTRKGLRLYAEIEPLALSFERDVLSRLSAEEQDAFRATVKRLIDGLGPAAADEEPQFVANEMI
jgi:DNA-binding MarR family transcriptional regulator